MKSPEFKAMNKSSGKQDVLKFKFTLNFNKFNIYAKPKY